LVPCAKSQFVYGLGMNLDPMHKRLMRWAGWNKPFVVRDVKGREYPNADWPDDGSGAVDPKSGKRYYFVAQANAKITLEVLNGATGARRQIVVLNAALAIVAGGKAVGVREGIAVAEGCIDSGAAIKKLQALIEMSRS